MCALENDTLPSHHGDTRSDKLIFFHFELFLLLLGCALCVHKIFNFSSIFRTYSQCKQSVTNKIIIIAFGGMHGERKMMMTQARKLNIVSAGS